MVTSPNFVSTVTGKAPSAGAGPESDSVSADPHAVSAIAVAVNRAAERSSAAERRVMTGLESVDQQVR